MALTTRALTNIGAPLYTPSGTLLANVRVSFLLVNAIGQPTDAFDVTTNERVIGETFVMTNSFGEFTVNLWPNDRGDKITKYVCRCEGTTDFSSQVPSGGAPLSWYAFKTSGAILTQAEVTLLDQHIANALLHLTPQQNTLLDAIDPTLTGAEVNHIKGATSNIQEQINALPSAPTKAPLIAGDPNGFLDASQVALSWNNITRTLTISPVGANFQFYSDSNFYIKSVADSIVIPDVTSNYVVYYNTAGVLTYSSVFDIQVILKYAFVASIYWNSSIQKAVPDALNELHGCSMDSYTHLYNHSTKGTAFGIGITPSIITNGTGSLDSNIQVSASTGIIWDEDLKHTIPARISTDLITVCYRLGASTWSMSDTLSTVVIPTGTGRAAYNQNNAGTWQLTECPNNDYVLAHLYAVPGLTKKHIIIMGINSYTSATLARDAARIEITNIVDLPILEAKLIATLVVQTNNTYTNSVKSRLQQTISGSEDYVDWRYVATVAGVPSHF